MRGMFRARTALGAVKHAIAGTGRNGSTHAHNELPPLYYSPQSHRWFRENVQRRYRSKLRLWSSTYARFNQSYLSDTRAGRFIAKAVFRLEGACEPIAARYGEYPMFVIAKD